MNDVTDFLWSGRSLRNDVFIKPPKFDEEKKSAHTYASFGNNGITVSVNAYGHIMQMSRYLGFGCSGFLCVDSQYNPPYWVQSRMRDILASSRMPDQGLRLDIMDWSGIDILSSGFMYDRWPRYVINKATQANSGEIWEVPSTQNSSAPMSEQVAPIPNIENSPKVHSTVHPTEDSSVPKGEPLNLTPDYSLSIQHYCFENTVIQQYQLIVGDAGLSHDSINWGKLSLIPKVGIRGLNFVDDLDFDDDKAEPERRISSESSIALVRAIPKEHYAQEESKQRPQEEDSTEQTEQKEDHDMKEESKQQSREEDSTKHNEQQKEHESQPVAAVLIISPFINDRPANIVDGTCISLERAEGEVRLVITVAYTVKLLYSDCCGILEKLSEPISNVDHDQEATAVVDAQPTERFVTEPVGNADDSHKTTPVIGAEATERSLMDHDRGTTSIVSAETDQRPVPKSDVDNMSEPDAGPMQVDRQERSTIGEESDLVIKKRELVEGWATEVMEAMQEMSKVFCKETTFRRICFSPNEDMDYAFRRNLEHILSVCSIPIATDQNKNSRSPQAPAVAITCGDIAGHRIGPRASL
jgi:hypothetical protein